uniref:Uncharacterized protein n=1 Tax=Rhipicephalus zambeziensis TaxID=60191 RepID=A0A224YG80_9ACAR
MGERTMPLPAPHSQRSATPLSFCVSFAKRRGTHFKRGCRHRVYFGGRRHRLRTLGRRHERARVSKTGKLQEDRDDFVVSVVKLYIRLASRSSLCSFLYKEHRKLVEG